MCFYLFLFVYFFLFPVSYPPIDPPVPTIENNGKVIVLCCKITDDLFFYNVPNSCRLSYQLLVKGC